MSVSKLVFVMAMVDSFLSEILAVGAATAAGDESGSEAKRFVW